MGTRTNGEGLSMLEAAQPSLHVKVAIASLIGTAIEWYDFFLYGTAAALIFNKLFFPTFDPTGRNSEHRLVSCWARWCSRSFPE